MTTQPSPSRLKRLLSDMPAALQVVLGVFALIPIWSLTFATPPWRAFASESIVYAVLTTLTFWVVPLVTCASILTRSFLFILAFAAECLLMLTYSVWRSNETGAEMQIVRFALLGCLALSSVFLLNKDILFPFLNRFDRFWRRAGRAYINAKVTLVADDGTEQAALIQDCSLSGLGVMGDEQRLGAFMEHVKATRSLAVRYKSGEQLLQLPATVAWSRSAAGMLNIGLRVDDVDGMRALMATTAKRAGNQTLADRFNQNWASSSFRRAAITLWALNVAGAFGVPACGTHESHRSAGNGPQADSHQLLGGVLTPPPVTPNSQPVVTQPVVAKPVAGGTTTTVTNPDGSVTTTTIHPDGSVTTITMVMNPDGSVATSTITTPAPAAGGPRQCPETDPYGDNQVEPCEPLVPPCPEDDPYGSSQSRPCLYPKTASKPTAVAGNFPQYHGEGSSCTPHKYCIIRTGTTGATGSMGTMSGVAGMNGMTTTAGAMVPEVTGGGLPEYITQEMASAVCVYAAPAVSAYPTLSGVNGGGAGGAVDPCGPRDANGVLNQLTGDKEIAPRTSYVGATRGAERSYQVKLAVKDPVSGSEVNFIGQAKFTDEEAITYYVRGPIPDDKGISDYENAPFPNGTKAWVLAEVSHKTAMGGGASFKGALVVASGEVQAVVNLLNGVKGGKSSADVAVGGKNWKQVKEDFEKSLPVIRETAAKDKNNKNLLGSTPFSNVGKGSICTVHTSGNCVYKWGIIDWNTLTGDTYWEFPKYDDGTVALFTWDGCKAEAKDIHDNHAKNSVRGLCTGANPTVNTWKNLGWTTWIKWKTGNWVDYSWSYGRTQSNW